MIRTVLFLVGFTAAAIAMAADCPSLCREMSAREIQARFLALNPHLKASDIEHKVAGAKNAFKLYRAVVPAFYDSYIALKAGEVARVRGFSAPVRASLTRLEKHEGWMYGDVHPENFGAALSDEGKAVFTINDLDDGGRGPVALDLLRYLGSLRLHQPGMSLDPVIDAYQEGLAGKPLPKARSKWRDEFLEAAEEEGRVTQKRLHDSKRHGIARDGTMQEVSKAQLGRIEEALKRAFGGASQGRLKVRDGVQVVRDHGGSGGLDRYLVLLKVGKDAGIDGKHVLIELKQVAEAGMRLVWKGAGLDAEGRIRQGLFYSQGAEASRYSTAVRVGDTDLLVRPKFRGNSGVDLSELSKKKASKLFETEAHTLGALHRRSLAEPEAYLRDLRETPSAHLEEVSERIAEVFESYFRTLKARQ